MKTNPLPWLLTAAVLALAQGVSFAATTLVHHGEAWRYRKGTNAPTSNWKTISDASLDATWITGAGGFGYSDNPAELINCATILPDMIGTGPLNYRTLYLRRQFTVTNVLATNLNLYLQMDFDDGFIAWLDGNYLTNRFVTGAPAEPPFNTLANANHESSQGSGSPQPAETYNFGQASLLLTPGTHTLAIIGLNQTATSSDFIQVADLFLEEPSVGRPRNDGSFEDWAREHGFNTGSATDDPDGDGRVNLVEHATGSNPLDASSFERLKIAIDGGIASLAMALSTNAPDVIFRLQAATNLNSPAGWQTLAEKWYPTPWRVDPVVTSISESNSAVAVTIPLSVFPASHFFRLQVERPGRGAILPWTTYEAEDMTTTGTVLGPSYTGQNVAREASRRSCVRLNSTGQYVEFTATNVANGIVVRYSIPDTLDGVGTNVTLSLYTNGVFSRKLPLTSKYSFLYGSYPFTNSPAAGTPRNFWDEARLMPGNLQVGDVIRLQKDATDNATDYFIDLVDLEAVAPPLTRPTNFVSVTEFGATPGDGTDDTTAFINAIAAAKTQRKGVWIPAGDFIVSASLNVSDVTIQGAGMWYSNLIGLDNYTPSRRVTLNGRGSNVTLSDFAIIGKLNYRNDVEGNDGIGGSYGTGSIIRNLWVEHTKVGAWIVNSDGLLVEGCRFRNTIADGINLSVGMRNSIVRNCTARGPGDDCFAIWPATYIASAYSPGFNLFKNCTAQLPFLAQGFSIYGGENNTVEDCEVIDIPYGAGVFASTTFGTEFGFRGTSVFRRIRITRSGGSSGTIGTVANLVDLAGLRFRDIDMFNSATDGIKFTSSNGRSLNDTTFDRITVENPGRNGTGYGIVEQSGAVGSATMSNTTVVNPSTAGWLDNSGSFNLIRGTGNSGW